MGILIDNYKAHPIHQTITDTLAYIENQKANSRNSAVALDSLMAYEQLLIYVKHALDNNVAQIAPRQLLDNLSNNIKNLQSGHALNIDGSYTTTMSLQEEALGTISKMLGKETLLICCGAFTGNIHAYENITIKKIPAAVLKKCEWGKPGYPLPVREDFKDSDFEFEE